MKHIKVAIVSLGSLKYPIDIAYLEGWHSDFMKIVHGASVGHLPNAEGDNWQYPNDQLRQLIHADPEANFTVALINAPLEDNYYMRRLGDKIAVLSLFEMADITRFSYFTIENYILRNIYELVVLYAANGQLIPSDAHSWAHDEIRGCLFDMNASKPDIVFSMHKPTLCQSCRTRILSKQLNSGFLPALDRELAKIQKALYFRIAEWVKEHPLYALAITAGSGVLLNLIASIIFEKAKKALPWLG
jgi:hypothetical protein